VQKKKIEKILYLLLKLTCGAKVNITNRAGGRLSRSKGNGDKTSIFPKGHRGFRPGKRGPRIRVLKKGGNAPKDTILKAMTSDTKWRNIKKKATYKGLKDGLGGRTPG